MIIFKGDKTFTTKIDNCARCCQTHLNLEFKEIYNPKDYSHFAMCPNTNQPILLSIVDKIEVWSDKEKKWI